MVVTQLVLVVLIAGSFGMAAVTNLLPLMVVSAAGPVAFLFGSETGAISPVHTGLAMGLAASGALLIVRRAPRP